MKTDVLEVGWEAARRGAAGISVVALYDTATERYHLYDENNLDACIEHLNEADALVGFNSKSWDTPVIECISTYSIYAHQVDLLEEIWRALGSKVKGYKLKDICPRLGLGSKNAAGDSAAQLYADGRYAELFDYCINDVHLTRALCNWINDNGYITTPEGEPLELPRLGVPA